jgi:hypothetical protein
VNRLIDLETRRLGMVAIGYIRRQLAGEKGPVRRLCRVPECPACRALSDPLPVGALPAADWIDVESRDTDREDDT